ncbi:MAG: RNA polymerase sigma factor, partial [Nocardiopsaceae bacterium]|nr:RNA polymerase sigma factor [Nocardiopsaceae bacterium]
MPRIAMAAPSDDEATSRRVDDLIQRGRSQGHLSLSDLRTAFEQAGLTPAEARSILRELSEAGVRLADEENDLAGASKPSRAAKGTAKPGKQAADQPAADKPGADKAGSAKPA